MADIKKPDPPKAAEISASEVLATVGNADLVAALEAVEELLESSLAPALALLPSGMRRDIQDKADAVKEAIGKCGKPT